MNLGLSLLFSLAQQRKAVKGCFAVFTVKLGMGKMRQPTAELTGKCWHVLISVQNCSAISLTCNDLHPSLTFDLGNAPDPRNYVKI